MKLLSDGSHKWDLSDGAGKGFLTKGMYLSPARSGGRGNVCPFSTPGCRKACLVSSGRMGAYVDVRAQRTLFFFEHRQKFMMALAAEIHAAYRKAWKEGLKLAVRLNGTSDIAWESVRFGKSENLSVMEWFPQVQFYDYTKNPKRMTRFLGDPTWPRNYHLTFSRSEGNETACREILAMGGNVAAVMTEDAAVNPSNYLGAIWIIDGDAHDLTFLHPPGSILILSPKGKARKDTSGFVVRGEEGAP